MSRTPRTPRPPALSRQLMLRLDPAQYDAIAALASLERWTVAQAARVLLDRGLAASPSGRRAAAVKRATMACQIEYDRHVTAGRMAKRPG
jgi:hypothetical protein